MAFGDFLQRVADELFDLLHGICTARGQSPNFLSDHSKTFAVLTCARGFDRGVQRQDIGLESD
ncbi:hypothetical protein D1872_340360 [compost metagenome]